VLGRNGAVGLVNGPHELLSDELAYVGTIGLDVAVLRREVARLAYATVEKFEEVVLERGCRILFGVSRLDDTTREPDRVATFSPNVN